MRDCWYGDKRDIVKWAVLISLAHDCRIRTILWVVLYQSDQPQGNVLHIGDHAKPIPPEVWAHFRDIGQISRLGPPAGVKIKVLDRPWKSKAKPKRDAYFKYVIKNIKDFHEPVIVFLDPDTGLGRDGKRTAKHVCPIELREVFGSMKNRDSLVFYQHAQRRKDWRKITRKRFAEAIGLSLKNATPARSDEAKDAIFFIVRKNRGYRSR